jgi:hypothetical protein
MGRVLSALLQRIFSKMTTQFSPTRAKRLPETKRTPLKSPRPSAASRIQPYFSTTMAFVAPTDGYLLKLRGHIHSQAAMRKSGFVIAPLTEEELLLKRRCEGCRKSKIHLVRGEWTQLTRARSYGAAGQESTRNPGSYIKRETREEVQREQDT